jgi:hypothetical protein
MPVQNYTRQSDDPGVRHFSITPDSNTDLAVRPSAFYVQTDGVLVLRDIFGTDISYTVFAGQIIPFEAARVMAGTTATVIGWA